MKNIDLEKKHSEKSRSSLFLQKKIENENHFKNYIQKKKMRNLILEGKITICKTLAIFKIIYLATVAVLSNCTITQVKKIHKEFVWNHKKTIIKEKSLINNFDKGGLKHVDIPSKITSL